MEAVPATDGAVEVTLLDGGGFTTCVDTLIHADGHDQPYFLYDWCFFVHHRPTGRKILWDLGISDDLSLYTPFVLNGGWKSANPVGPRIHLLDQLKSLGVDAGEIDTVIFSHAHWDHCRPAKSEFPNAKVLFGPGTSAYCSPGHIRQGKILPEVQWDARFFSDNSDTRTETCDELDGAWVPWGPFDLALDYFKDGSFWIIQAPGHMPGNLAACARIPSGDYVLFGSDCCHSRAIFDGSRDIANFELSNGTRFCLHEDLGAALETIDRIRVAVDKYGMHMALAHDAEFIKLGEDQVLMSILHPSLKSKECLGRIRAAQRP